MIGFEATRIQGSAYETLGSVVFTTGSLFGAILNMIFFTPH